MPYRYTTAPPCSIWLCVIPIPPKKLCVIPIHCLTSVLYAYDAVMSDAIMMVGYTLLEAALSTFTLAEYHVMYYCWAGSYTRPPLRNACDPLPPLTTSQNLNKCISDGLMLVTAWYRGTPCQRGDWKRETGKRGTVKTAGLENVRLKTWHQTAGLENAGKSCMESQTAYFTCSV